MASDLLVMHEMAERKKNIRAANIITGGQKIKGGGEIKIAVDDETFQEVMKDLVDKGGKFGFALYIVEMEEFEKIKEELDT